MASSICLPPGGRVDSKSTPEADDPDSTSVLFDGERAVRAYPPCRAAHERAALRVFDADRMAHGGRRQTAPAIEKDGRSPARDSLERLLQAHGSLREQLLSS